MRFSLVWLTDVSPPCHGAGLAQFLAGIWVPLAQLTLGDHRFTLDW